MSRTVLVVEDNPITRKVVRVALVGEGYAVLEAETGVQAIEEMERKSVDLVLQDLALCDMDGFQLLGRLRGLARVGTPILAFTGLADHARIRAAGFDDLLLKPVEPSRLVEAVRRHLTRRASQVELAALTTARTLAGAPPDRAWQAMAAMLAKLNELTGGELSVSTTVANVLASFLDVSGFSVGAAYVYGTDGQPELGAHLGFSTAGVRDLSELCKRQAQSWNVASYDLSYQMQTVFEEGGASSMMAVPLVFASQPVGLLVLGTGNPEIPADLSQLATLVAAPIAQTVLLARSIARLAVSEHKFRGIAESTADGIAVTNARGEITYLNPAARQILGSEAENAISRSLGTILPLVISGSWQGNVRRLDGVEIPLEVSVRCFEDPPGHISRAYVLRDLSERHRLKEVAHLANHDALTGLFNRRRFDEDLGSRLADLRRYGVPGALLVIDLDRFKPINDTFGHQAGDAVLKAVADILKDHTRDSDTSARLGGDEFAVLLNHVNAAGAEACAAKLLDRIAKLTVPFGGHALRVGASIGLALFPEHGVTEDAVFAAADAALYQAKRFGRNQLSISPTGASEDNLSFVVPRLEGGRS